MLEASAEPLTVGELLFAGLVRATEETVGADGALESSVYETEVDEQPDVFPEESVEVA